MLLIGVGKHLFISLFATGVHDKKINKLALWSDCTTTLPAFPTLMSHIPLCPFIKESFELMQNAFLETLFSSGVVLESLLLSYVCTALSTSATSLKLQINRIKTCFFPQHELKKQFVNLKTFHQSRLNSLINAVESSCLCIDCSVTSWEVTSAVIPCYAVIACKSQPLLTWKSSVHWSLLTNIRSFPFALNVFIAGLSALDSSPKAFCASPCVGLAEGGEYCYSVTCLMSLLQVSRSRLARTFTSFFLVHWFLWFLWASDTFRGLWH